MKTTMMRVMFVGAALMALNVSAQTKIEKGKELVTSLNCASCHGIDYNTPTDPTYPKLAGQHEDYLRQSLVIPR
jgi:cytochrome c553